MQRHHSSHLVLENFHEVHASVRTDDNLVFKSSWLNLVDVTNGLKAFAYVDWKRTDWYNIDEAVILSTDDLVVVNLSHCADARLCLDILDALEVLLHVVHLNLALPRSDKNKFVGKQDAFG